MKKSIALAVAALFLSTGLFASTLTTTKNENNNVTLDGVQSTVMVSVKASDALQQKTLVAINDSEGHELYRAKLTAGVTKRFNLALLENGNYTFTILTGKQQLKQKVHVYEEEGQKTFFFIQ